MCICSCGEISDLHYLAPLPTLPTTPASTPANPRRTLFSSHFFLRHFTRDFFRKLEVPLPWQATCHWAPGLLPQSSVLTRCTVYQDSYLLKRQPGVIGVSLCTSTHSSTTLHLLHHPTPPPPPSTCTTLHHPGPLFTLLHLSTPSSTTLHLLHHPTPSSITPHLHHPAPP